MRYCISSRQPSDIIALADEILVQERDYREIPDLFIKYPEKIIILDCSSDFLNSEKSKSLIQYAKASENFICRLQDLKQFQFCKDNGIKFYYRYPVSTFFEVNSLMDIGVEYITVTMPLTFQMNALEKISAKFRMVPNVAYDAYIPKQNGIYGQWVRPEDVEYYESGIYIFEFENVDLLKEKTLFHIYKNNKTWPGNLNHLFTNFNLDTDNRGVLVDIGKKRSNCGQRCQITHKCDYCNIALNFSKTVLEYAKQKQSQKQT